VGHVSELKEGESKVVSAKDLTGQTKFIALFLSGGVVTAHSAICTHQGCTVGEAGKQLACPCHGSVYNAQTGSVINGPAELPLPALKVATVGGEIYIV
jgi:Rieske Fe-S protein